MRSGVLRVAMILAVLVGAAAARAGDRVEWSAPQPIPGYPPGTYSPYLVVDGSGVVHAFHSQPIGDTISIVYSHWDAEHGWTEPVELFSPLRGEAQMKGAWLDAHGTTHLIFTNGNDQLGGDLFYSRAPAREAGSVLAWSAPRLIGPSANLFAGAILGDDRGSLYAVYGGSPKGNGLYVVASHDGGDSWAPPMPVRLITEAGVLAGDVALLLDERRVLHAAWAEWKPPNARDLYYARLDLDADRPASPVRLASGGADTPVVAEHDGSLFVIYATSGIANGRAGKAMLRSGDGGRTWSTAVWAFPPLFGGNGNAALVHDGSHAMHALLGNRTGDCCHGLWHSTWLGNAWSEPQAIVQGPKTVEFDPFSPHAVVVRGNILLVTWWNESKSNGVWYATARLDAPEIPAEPLPRTPAQIVPFGPPEEPPRVGHRASAVMVVLGAVLVALGGTLVVRRRRGI